MKKIVGLILGIMLLMHPVSVFAQKHIEINIPSRTLMLYTDDLFIKKYPIAVGRPSYDSPIGHYSIISKLVNPTWAPTGQKPVPPGPKNPLGTRWIGFFSAYGIHGNSDPKSIGTFASKGCIRMYNYDVEELFSMVDKGDSVNIYYNTLFTYDNPNKDLSTLIVYPDLYNKRINSRERINDDLKRMELDTKIPKEKLENLFSEINKKAVVFSKNWAVFINGEYITSDTAIRTEVKQQDTGVDDSVELIEKIIQNEDLPKDSSNNNLERKRSKADMPIVQNKEVKPEPVKIEMERKFENILVNMYDINYQLGLNLHIDEDLKIKVNDQDIYFEINNQIPYVLLMDLINKIGGQHTVEQKQETINWSIAYGKLDNSFFNANIITTSSQSYIWVRDILNALKLEGIWDEQQKALLVKEKVIQGKIITDKMYLTPSQIKEYFGLNAQYLSFQNRFLLTQAE